MSRPVEGGAPAPPAWRPLPAEQRRVLGVLIEKAKTTPATYPITVNAIVTGCNQKNNRDPLTSFDDTDVEGALHGLCSLGAASEIDWLGRVVKYKHHAYEWLGVSRLEMAVMAELLLRGAQPLGDLRARAARLEPIADLAELKPIVDALVERRLMIELSPAGRGQVVSHNLYLAPELEALRSQYSGQHFRSAPPAGGGYSPRPLPVTGLPARPAQEHAPPAAPADALTMLVAEISRLRAEVAELRGRLGAIESKVDRPAG